MSNEKSSINYEKIIIYLVVALLGGNTGYDKFLKTDDTKETVVTHVDNTLNTRLDSIEDKLKQGMRDEIFITGAINNHTGLGMRESNDLLGKLIDVGIKGIKNDSIWTNEQLPFIKWLIENQDFLEQLFKYQYLVPMKSREDTELYFNWTDGVYPITEKATSNGGIVRRWRDRGEDVHPLQSISNIPDNN